MTPREDDRRNRGRRYYDGDKTSQRKFFGMDKGTFLTVFLTFAIQLASGIFGGGMIFQRFNDLEKKVEELTTQVNNLNVKSIGPGLYAPGEFRRPKNQ